MTLNRAECELRIGLLTEAEGRLSWLLKRAENRIEDSAVTCLRVAVFMSQGRFDHSVEVCLGYLRRAGIDWSPHPTKEQVEQENAKIWQQLGTRQIEELLDLPLATDPDCRATQDVLAVLSTPAWFTDENLHELVGAHIANLSLEYGNCDGSCHGYARLGALLGSKLGQYQAGFRFGQLAIDLMEKHRLHRFEALVYTAFAHHILPWTKHVKAGRAWNQRALRAARESGNLAFVAFSFSNLIANLFASGEPLGDVEREAENGHEFAQKTGFNLVSDYIISGLRLIRSLRGLTPNFGCFSDADFEESRFEQHLEESPRFALAACRYWIRKLQACFYAGDYPAAIAAARKAQPLQVRRSFFEVAEYPFFSALAHAALYSSSPSEEQASYLETILAHHRQLAIWALNCPENFDGCAALVGAEIARMEGRELDAARLYEHAIGLSRQHGFVQNEAIAYEVGARFYSGIGFESIARSYLQNACDAYLRWGALGKVKDLEVRHPGLRVGSPLLVSNAIASSMEQVDHLALAKASQAVSSELNVSKLIETLLVIAIENAGAQRGLIILLHNEEPHIEAEATARSQAITVDLRRSAPTPAELPASILRWVIRTQESVILDDASTSNQFAADEYIQRNQARSVLCLPLVKQASLQGALYLENNLASHVFTPDRISVLRLLVSQAAISLDHARLYADLIQENNDRKKAEEALRASEERWSMLAENSSAGIALLAADGRFIAANVALQKTLGYTENELRELSAVQITHEADQAATEDFLAGANPETRQVHRFDMRFVHKNGSVIWADVSVVFVPASGTNSAFFSLVIVDITERKIAEEALRKAQTDLVHVSRVSTLGELSASIAHEINQPLAALVTDAGACMRWLAAQNLEEARKCTSRMIANGTRAGGIIARIRALARKAPPQKDRLDLNEIIGEVLSITGAEFRRNRVSLETRLSQKLPSVMGDKIQLQQVILNLLVNAIESMSEMSEGRRDLLLTSEKVTQPSPERIGARFSPAQDHLLVTVQDSGPGLDPATMDHLFDTFYTTKPQGLGMGLAISRSIIEAHGGRLQATSNQPKGASFQFTLPVEVA